MKGLTLYSGICYNEIISLKTSLLWILTLFGQILFLINKCIILLSLVLEIERVISKKKNCNKYTISIKKLFEEVSSPIRLEMFRARYLQQS